jgi:hypothetical protein
VSSEIITSSDLISIVLDIAILTDPNLKTKNIYVEKIPMKMAKKSSRKN